jgi:hypothetical protein
LDLQRTSYGFSYGSLLSLAELVHSHGGIIPFTLSSLDGTSASDVAHVIIVLNIRKRVVFTIKWLPWA